MRVLFLSKSGDGAWLVAVLGKNGHHVDWTLDESDKYAETLEGIVPKFLKHIPDPDPYDLIVFDECTYGEDADEMRKVTPVIGCSAFAEKLEDDRLFGIEFMQQCGIVVPPYEPFDNVDKAIKWLEGNNKRYVLKPSGHVKDKALTYVSESAEDMIGFLEKSNGSIKEFVLQEFIEGTEVSTNAWFNGERFFALDHSLEEKKFMSGGIGPNTGCSGVTYWMPEGETKLFKEGLGKIASKLAAANFVGPIDLNTICTKNAAYGLEWTPRFGYEGISLQMSLLPMEIGEFLFKVATGEEMTPFDSKANFAASVRITVPPYPKEYEGERTPSKPVKGITPEDIDTFYLSDVKVDEDYELQTLGTDGLVGAPVATGDTIKEAFAAVQKKIDKLQIPDLQYRNDIAECCERRYSELSKMGWLDDASE